MLGPGEQWGQGARAAAASRTSGASFPGVCRHTQPRWTQHPHTQQAALSLILLSACGHVERLYGGTSLGLATAVLGMAISAAYIAALRTPSLQA